MGKVTSQNGGNADKQGGATDATPVENLQWFFKFSESLQTAMALDMVDDNAEFAEHVAGFSDLGDSAQIEYLEDAVRRFIEILPLAEVNGVNLFTSLIGTCANAAGLDGLVAAIDLHNEEVMIKMFDNDDEEEGN